MATLWLRRVWPAGSLLAAALAVLAGGAAAADEGAIAAEPRGLQLSGSNQQELVDALTSTYLHAHYKFSLSRQNMHREGIGELWLSFAGGAPRLRLRGTARSPRFGEGEITIVVDSGTETMYALFKLGELHEAQCVRYPFPKPADNVERLRKLRWRRTQVMKWIEEESAHWGEGAQLLTLNWTRSYVLEFLLGKNGTKVAGVDLRQGRRVVKTVRLVGAPEEYTDVPQDAAGAFDPPSESCSPADEVGDALARVELKPPHRKSSALNDLLLTLADKAQGGDWPQLFIMLSTITVPGDVAVMIEDPEPPHPEALGGVAFDYTADVMSRGVKHTSEGSIWLNLAERAFRLRGEAKQTKVGPLYMDLIAIGGHNPQVYANVNLTVQEEQQCVAYDYPDLTNNATGALKGISQQGLSFFAIAELKGEDCGIFVAPLARGRWIHIWVDMEGDSPDAILRSEIHKDGQVLRTTDVLRWHTGEDIGVSVRPAPQWDCSTDPGTGQLAHLGLKDVHKRSIQLQDALYALHALSRSFAILEILGLTGDVAIMVQEPELPELWRLPAASFSYSLYWGPANGDPKADGHTFTGGSFAADLRRGRVRMTARTMTPSSVNISVALDPGNLAVLVEAFGAEPQCLTLPLGKDSDLVGGTGGQGRPVAKAGIFDGVEAVGDAECNRFTFLGTGDKAESVEFWFSKEEDTVCRLEVLPPSESGAAGMGALVNVPSWEPVYSPGGHESFADSQALAGAPAGWHCTPAAEAERSWLSLARVSPPHALPGSVALAKLAEASGVVGMLPTRAADTLRQLVVMSPSAGAEGVAKPSTTPPQAQVDLFGPELQNFAFSFSSTYPLQGRAAGGNSALRPQNRGSGELRVDLAKRRLYLRSEAKNVSAGIPQVESRVIFRGDRGRLYARTKMDAEDFEQCWSVRTVEAVPAPIGGAQPNPFARGTLAGRGFSLPGGEGKHAAKYSFYLNQKKRVELFVDDSNVLAAMNLDDLDRDLSAGIIIDKWSTAPIDDGWFEPSADWKCEDLQFLEYAEQIAEWDLIRVFFPVEPVPLNEEGRRLLRV